MSPFRVKNREILVARRPRYRALSENHEILWDPSRFSSLLHPFIIWAIRCENVENYFTSALARFSRQWVLKIFIFWTCGSSGRAADLKGDRLISLKDDNGPDGTMGFDFEVKRPRRHILSLSRFLPIGSFSPLFRGRGEDLIFWFTSSMQPGAADDFPTQWDYHRQLSCYVERLTTWCVCVMNPDIKNPWILYN